MAFIRIISWICTMALVMLSCPVDCKRQNQCPNGLITKPMVIESPLYEEGLLPNYFRCSYNIRAPLGKQVVVEFSTFSLPPVRTVEKMNVGPIETECVASFLQVTIAEKDSTTLKFCGKELENKRLLSPDAEMQLLFQSLNVMGFDEKSFKGFKAEIKFLDFDEVKNNCDNLVILAEKQITIEMEPESRCSMAVKGRYDPKKPNYIPEVTLTSNHWSETCEVNLLMDSQTALKTDNNRDNSLQYFDCKKPISTSNKNLNLLPFVIENEGETKASFDIKVNYRQPTAQACGGEIPLTADKLPININLGPGRYSCMWTYTTKRTSLDNQNLTPKITLDAFGMAEPTNGLCLTNNLAVVLENTNSTQLNSNNHPLLCGAAAPTTTWSNTGIGKDLKMAILFSGTIAKKQHLLITGEIQLK